MSNDVISSKAYLLGVPNIYCFTSAILLLPFVYINICCIRGFICLFYVRLQKVYLFEKGKSPNMGIFYGKLALHCAFSVIVLLKHFLWTWA